MYVIGLQDDFTPSILIIGLMEICLKKVHTAKWTLTLKLDLETFIHK